MMMRINEHVIKKQKKGLDKFRKYYQMYHNCDE